jgi:hypothetical protein
LQGATRHAAEAAVVSERGSVDADSQGWEPCWAGECCPAGMGRWGRGAGREDVGGEFW